MDPLRDLSVCTLALALAMLTSPGCCADRVFSLSNGYIRVMGEGARITSMGCDPTGQGQYAAGDLRQLLYPELAERLDCRWEKQGDAIVVNGLEVRR